MGNQYHKRALIYSQYLDKSPDSNNQGTKLAEMQFWVEVKKVAALSDIENYLGKTQNPESRAMLLKWKDQVLKEIPKQSEILKRYNRLIERKKTPILHVEIDKNSFRKKSAYTIPCPGCNLMLPQVDVCRLQRMDAPVYCQNCHRILYSDGFFVFSWKLEQSDIASAKISLPTVIELGTDPTFRDIYGNRVSVNVTDDFICGLEELFRSYALKEGNTLKLRVLSLEKNDYAFVPEIKTPSIDKQSSIEDIEDVIDEKKGDMDKGLILAEILRGEELHLDIVPQKHRIMLDENSISKGILKVPSSLAKYFERCQTVFGDLRPLGNVELKWYLSTKVLKGLGDWYSFVALEPGDYVNVELEDKDKTKIIIWTEWQRALDKILEQPAEDFVWQDKPIRDCLIFIFKKINREAHYRELYAEISRHRKLAMGSIIGTLSKYRYVLFGHVGKGSWKLLDKDKIQEEKEKRERGEREIRSTEEQVIDWEKIWNAVQVIEEKDLVFRVLKIRKEPLSFNEICEILGKYLKVESKLLKQTGLLNAEDQRLQRIDDGSWILGEWVAEPILPPGEECELKKEPQIKEKVQTISSPISDTKMGIFMWVIIFSMCGAVILYLLYLLILLRS